MKQFDDVDAAGLILPRFRDGTNRNKCVQHDLSGMSGSSTLIVSWNDQGMDNSNLWIPRCMVHHNANQSIVSGVATVLAMNQEDWDNDSMHDTVTNNSRITINHDGVYLVGASANFAAGNTGWRQIMIRKNGTAVIVLQTQVTIATAPPDIEFSCNIIHKCVATDYFEVIVVHTQGVNLNLQVVANRSPYFYAERLSAA